MKTLVDERLVDEARRYRLRFCCEDCAYVDPTTLACSEEYPNEAHRGVELQRVTAVFFCKRFELL